MKVLARRFSEFSTFSWNFQFLDGMFETCNMIALYWLYMTFITWTLTQTFHILSRCISTWISIPSSSHKHIHTHTYIGGSENWSKENRNIVDILMPTANIRRFADSIHASSTFANRFALNMNFRQMGEKPTAWKKANSNTHTQRKKHRQKEMIEIICTKHERTRKGFIIFCDIDFLFAFRLYIQQFFFQIHSLSNQWKRIETNWALSKKIAEKLTRRMKRLLRWCDQIKPDNNKQWKSFTRANFKGPQFTSTFHYSVCAAYWIQWIVPAYTMERLSIININSIDNISI